eukprot:1988773-Rhodomonas_salina.7
MVPSCEPANTCACGVSPPASTHVAATHVTRAGWALRSHPAKRQEDPGSAPARSPLSSHANEHALAVEAGASSPTPFCASGGWVRVCTVLCEESTEVVFGVLDPVGSAATLRFPLRVRSG